MKSNVFSSPINGLSRGVGHEIAAIVDRLFEAPFIWAERAAERRHLSELDDHLLNDIGLNRADVETVSTKPFWRA
jgi:uncharacterized protein YjiS (DUF1127 family)